MRRAIPVLMLVLPVVGLVGVVTAHADTCDPQDDYTCTQTTGDDRNDSVVTSGVSFPNATPGSDIWQATHQNSQCTDCEWSVVPACLSDQISDANVMCTGAAAGCPDALDVLFRVYLRHGDGPWRLQGNVCLGPGDRPATVSDVGQAIRDRVVRYLPDAAPTFQPASGGLVNLPTLFAAGEPRTMTTRPFDVLGFSVVVMAHARWEWTFDHGIAKVFDQPGGAYPDQSVSYTYAGPGERDVSVTTYWSARFTVNGAGPFAVPGGEIAKTAGPIAVPVREAHSQLVGTSSG
ncbi:MAG: hypothetical protein QOE01_1862 [Actinomycetota bacterium]|nr:hypothetical protein [Actinomycetota bacterium]